MARDHQILPAGKAALHVHVASQRLAPGGATALGGEKHRGAAQQVVASVEPWAFTGWKIWKGLGGWSLGDDVEIYGLKKMKFINGLV